MYHPNLDEIELILDSQRRAQQELRHYEQLSENLFSLPNKDRENVIILRDFASSEESFYMEQMIEIANHALEPFENNLSLYFLGETI